MSSEPTTVSATVVSISAEETGEATVVFVLPAADARRVAAWLMRPATVELRDEADDSPAGKRGQIRNLSEALRARKKP